jgi:hypothetical protein
MADSLLRVAMAASNNGLRTKIADGAASGAITASTWTPTPMNTVVYDPLSQNSTSGAVGSITVKLDGYYIVSMRTSYLGVVDLTRMAASMWVQPSGGSIVGTLYGGDLTSGGAQAACMGTIGLLALHAGDLIAGYLYTSTGASTTAGVAALNTLEACWIGPL